MKSFLLSMLLLTAGTTSLFAQKTLTNSKTSGYYTYIYKLTDKETFEIASKSTAVINDGFLHTLVDSFYNVKSNVYPRKLPYGNYLKVRAVESKLQYNLEAISNISIAFISNTRDFQISVSDLKGNLLEDAVVKVGKSKRIKYNANSKLYIASSGAKPNVITVNYNGVNNFFTYDEEERYRPDKGPSFFRKLFNAKAYRHKSPQYKPEIPKYKGYMVFNKPMYKPADTVKFKAYLLTKEGKSLRNKPLRAELERNGTNVLLTTLNPYFEGGYEHSFLLHDSLNLVLGRNYNIVLKEQVKNEWKQVYSSYFRYEDYELKSVDFSVRTDKEEYSPGSPVTIYLKASDENELAVPDGRVEVVVTSNYPSNYYNRQVFVKDTLWKTNVVMDPVGETKLVLPDSIFPQADLGVSMSFTFLNSNNESRTAYKGFNYKVKSQEIKFHLVKDSLNLNYLVNGQSLKQGATIYTSYPNSDSQDSVKVQLPHIMTMDYHVSEYKIKTADGFVDYKRPEDMNANIKVLAAQNKDSLVIVASNVNKIPFWYTVFSGDKVFLRGYTTKLDTLIKHNPAKISQVKIVYNLGEALRGAQTSAAYKPNILSVKLLGPEIVYPGQTVNMLVNVTNSDGQPEAGTDVTAYAYTSKFKNAQNPEVPFFGKQYVFRKQRPHIDIDDINKASEIKLNWSKWGKALNLDTIEYYKFMNTTDLYSNNEAGNDTARASVAPFVVKDGAVEPVLVAYIDEVPVYFNNAEQPKRYAFWLSPGRHNIRLRTAEHLVILDGYKFVKGKRTVLAVAADVRNTKATVTKVTAVLSEDEAALLSQYMIRVENNFGVEKTTISNQNTTTLLSLPMDDGNGIMVRNQSARYANGKGFLFGPFPEMFLHFKSGDLEHPFLKEPGYTYTFEPGLIKQKSFPGKYVFNTTLAKSVDDNRDYKQYPIKRGEIDSIWNEYLNLRSSTSTLFRNQSGYSDDYGRLIMKLDTALAKKMPYVKNIIILKEGEPDFLQIFPGNSNGFLNLEKGKYRVLYLFRDNRYLITKHEEIKPKGKNYFEWTGLQVQAADSLSNKVDAEIKSVNSGRLGSASEDAKERISKILNGKFLNAASVNIPSYGRIFELKSKKPIQGALVVVKGLNSGTTTDVNGKFEIKTPSRGSIIISFIGHQKLEVKALAGNMGDFYLEESGHALNEVKVTAYGSETRTKTLMTGSVTTIRQEVEALPASDVMKLLQGKVAGLNIQEDASVMRGSVTIRGISNIPIGGADKAGYSSGVKPLIIVDGLPYNGDISDIDQATIDNINVLKDAEATAIYGSSGAGGVIIVKTKGGKSQTNAAGEIVQQQQQTMRSNFSDYAIWQPKLLTDAEGKASFKVKFPDDITNWTTKLVAVNGRKQSGVSESNIKSFKVFSANFVSPLFAVVGDSINVIGKLMNYSNVEEAALRKLSYNGTDMLNGAVKFKNAHIDTAAIVAKSSGKQTLKDSLAFEYSMKQDNGYFDGELRKIPLMQAGVLETKGFFNALMRDTIVTYNFDKSLGKVTLRAETSIFPTLLDEMEKLRNYEYLCNEQLASKLKALLLEKKVRKYLGEEFKEEKNITKIIEKLQKNKRPEGTWGWWQNSQEELWISLHVVEAMLQAQKQGYTVTLDKQRLYSYIVDKMVSQKYFDQIYGIRLLLLLNEKYYVKDWIEAIEKQRKEQEEKNLVERKKNLTTYVYKQPLYEKLQLMQLKQQGGMAVDLKWLAAQKKETMFGNIYWGEEGSRFWDNNIQNTLLAYQILKEGGAHRDELDAIARYFLEQRKDGQWRNTFESSLILETILPELMVDNKKSEPASISLNNEENITVFSFNKFIEPATLKLSKKGNAPVYFTAYQQFNNPKPEKVSKDFTVKTTLNQNGVEVKNLKAGTLTTLNVEVDVRADADYVMIEIPIPAGCSYENKIQSFWGVETHREYFKHKTSIFCTKLKAGKYNFSIQLLPRYSGNYVLNPAKAEMMYFPVFYGREEMKRVGIK
ncbi:alpha-2-macroglobulin family protein [Pedobacter frigoris]|uniref:alpha-2-macroglobulin family protein n=1 Tax=Pedobacter frigoris TaxID=2571272 RepID=UPI0029319F0F|nr:alpha-2-macroglobulin family protein [Pedobacter frigoris]